MRDSASHEAFVAVTDSLHLAGKSNATYQAFHERQNVPLSQCRCILTGQRGNWADPADVRSNNNQTVPRNNNAASMVQSKVSCSTLRKWQCGSSEFAKCVYSRTSLGVKRFNAVPESSYVSSQNTTACYEKKNSRSKISWNMVAQQHPCKRSTPQAQCGGT